MNARDFVYWLQGFFELCAAEGDPCSRLGVGLVECIRKHLALVEISKRASKAREFCVSLGAVLDMLGLDELDGAQTEQIRKRLHDVFEHEVDPSFPAKDQGALDAIHAALKPHPFGDKLIRC